MRHLRRRILLRTERGSAGRNRAPGVLRATPAISVVLCVAVPRAPSLTSLEENCRIVSFGAGWSTLQGPSIKGCPTLRAFRRVGHDAARSTAFDFQPRIRAHATELFKPLEIGGLYSHPSKIAKGRAAEEASTSSVSPPPYSALGPDPNLKTFPVRILNLHLERPRIIRRCAADRYAARLPFLMNDFNVLHSTPTPRRDTNRSPPRRASHK